MRSDNILELATFEPATLVDILRYRSIHQPEQIAYTFLVDGESQEVHFTYQTLSQQARSIAAHLQSCSAAGDPAKTKAQCRALLLFPPGLDYIAALFGCLCAGVVAVPAYPPERDRSLTRIRAILTDAQPTIALTSQAILTKLALQFDQTPELAALKWLTIEQITNDCSSQEWLEPAIQDLALLQYTSGSTATPKGVMISHQNLLHNLKSIHRAFGHRPESRGVIWLPPYHDMGLIGGVLQPLYGGFPVTLMSPLMFLQSPLRWLQAISRDRATTSGAPNFAYDLCVRKVKAEKANLDLSCWEVAFNGAEPIRAETLERFATVFKPHGFQRAAFYPCYGLAEATLMVAGGQKQGSIATQTISRTALAQNQVIAASSDRDDAQTVVGCGQSFADQEIRIVHPETLVPCAANQVGEIWVAGDSVAQGYWQKVEQTERVFQARLANTNQPFLRTGDLGFFVNNELFITGRLKDLIIIRGRNYYPQDIERTVQTSHAALSWGNGAAFSVNISGVEQLVIVQEVDRQALRQLQTEEVLQSIVQAVSEQHELQVYTIELLKPGSVLKTSSGKVQRYRCRDRFLAKTLKPIARWENLQAIDSSLESALASLEPELLLESEVTPISRTEEEIQTWLVTHLSLYLKVEAEEIDTTQPFAYYGLDSSVAVSITGELADWLGLDQLEPTLFWEYPSIEGLAEHLGESLD